MVPYPLHQRVQPIQSGVASHSYDVRPEELAIKTELSRKERTESWNHEAAGRDTQHVVDIRRRQGYGVQGVSDRPRPDFECSVPELDVEVACGFGNHAACVRVFRRKIKMSLLDVGCAEKLFHDPVLQAQERPDLFL
jgi:hypothetical protein